MIINRIKNERILLGLTQSDMADKLKISVRTYQRIENNQSKPSYYAIMKLQKIFNKPIDYLLQQVVDKIPNTF